MAQKKNSIVIYGCGNVIMGDDGFGPAVIDRLTSAHDLPRGVEAIDAGTGLREYLFDFLLSPENRPERVIILDAVQLDNRTPGELFLLDTESIPAKKIHDFSLHQFPTVNLLRELEEHTDIQVTILAAQAERIPDEISPGLSAPMQNVVPLACDRILHMVSENTITR